MLGPSTNNINMQAIGTFEGCIVCIVAILSSQIQKKRYFFWHKTTTPNSKYQILHFN